MISIGSGLVWNGLLKAFGGLPGLIQSVFFDFPNNYFFNRPPLTFFEPSLTITKAMFTFGGVDKTQYRFPEHMNAS